MEKRGSSQSTMQRTIRQRLQAMMPRHQESRLKRFFMWSVLLALSVLLAGLFMFTITVAFLSIGLPDVRDFDKLAGVESTAIFDRTGGTLYTIHGEENRKYVPLSEISTHLQKATIAIEDDQFYEHSGFDFSGITAAMFHEVFGIGAARGGSTITQQLAKNAFLSPKRTYTRKLKELILAVRLERAYDKNKILELYLNRIPYGNNAYGAEMAAKLYFGTTARELTLAQSAVLAAMPKAPTFYSPYGPNLNSSLDVDLNSERFKNNLPNNINDLERSDFTIGLMSKTISLSPTNAITLPGRSDVILRRMQDLGNITDSQRAQAEIELGRTEFKKYHETIRAAHFVFEIRRQLEEQFGKDVVAQGGLQVYTTLDPVLQDAAETAITDQIKVSKDAHGVTNSALFSVDAKNGEILAMVGAADYFDTEAHGNVNHVYAKRQPGSSFKPLLYTKVFTNRYAPATVLYDTQTNFGNNYIPQNYEGGFRGPMSIRQALGQSRNIPALKAYFLAGQQEEIVPFVQKMGLTSLDPKGDYGPPLAIGAAETTLSDMVEAFGVLASGGIKRAPFAITKVTDRDGGILFEHKVPDESSLEQVVDPQAAYLTTSILSDKSVYLGPRLDVPGHTTAAKTGTSNKEISPTKILPSNLWTIGYTPSIVTGVWFGNSDGSPMKPNADGYNVAAPVWAKFMKAALAGKPDEKFPVPEGIKQVAVSKASGKLPNKDTPNDARVTDFFASYSIPTETDDFYRFVEVTKVDDKLPNEFTPKEQIEKKLFIDHHDPISVFPRWAEGVRKWVTEKHKADPSFPDFPPTEETQIFNAENAKTKPAIQITAPVPYAVLSDRTVKIQVAVEAPNGIDRISFFLGDRTVPNNTKREAPYTGTIHFSANAKPGTYIITARVYDKIGYTAEAKIEVRYDGSTASIPTPEDPPDVPSPTPVGDPETLRGSLPSGLIEIGN